MWEGDYSTKKNKKKTVQIVCLSTSNIKIIQKKKNPPIFNNKESRSEWKGSKKEKSLSQREGQVADRLQIIV